ncbi:MAG: STAS domain-containing protein [Ferruginibacter sp.]
MNVKIDTKEKFTVLTPGVTEISANMTGNLIETLQSYLKNDIPHIVLNLNAVNSIDKSSAEKLSTLQQEFYEKNCSFIICALQPTVESTFDSLELLEVMNVTATESEAWDIIQMEEIERELMGDE